MKLISLQSNQIITSELFFASEPLLQLYYRIFKTDCEKSLPPILVTEKSRLDVRIDLNYRGWDNALGTAGIDHYHQLLEKTFFNGARYFLLDGNHRAVAAALCNKSPPARGYPRPKGRGFTPLAIRRTFGTNEICGFRKFQNSSFATTNFMLKQEAFNHEVFCNKSLDSFLIENEKDINILQRLAKRGEIFNLPPELMKPFDEMVEDYKRVIISHFHNYFLHSDSSQNSPKGFSLKDRVSYLAKNNHLPKYMKHQFLRY